MRTEGKAIGVRILLGVLIGGSVGFVVNYFGKCALGACPLTGNPFVSVVIGALLGALVAAGK
jgi:hypothetical protein